MFLGQFFIESIGRSKAVGEFLVVYIFVSGILGLPRSLISVAVFGLAYTFVGGASGSGVFSSFGNDNIFLIAFIVMSVINTYGMAINFKIIKHLLISK
jgi:hypothetical protein